MTEPAADSAPGTRLDAPLLSVILPVYNAAPTVERALASILAQTYAPAEIIVVDDGSKDRTVDLVRPWAERCELRLILRPRNGGPAAARNDGLAAARGRYVAFLDADDAWLPEKSAIQVALLQAHPGAVLCASDEHWIFADGSVDTTADAGCPEYSGPLVWKSLLARSVLHTSSVMVRRERLVEIGPFDENLLVGEDQDMWIRLAKSGDIVWAPQPLVQVYSRPDSYMKTHAGREVEFLLPMIERHIAQCGRQLSDEERRGILARRYGEVGRHLCHHGQWSAGCGLILRSAAMGHAPLRQLLFLIRNATPHRWRKRRA